MNSSAKNGEHVKGSVTIAAGGRSVKDSTDLPVVTASNVLNAGAQRARSLVLPRTGLALRALRRRVGLL